MIDKYGQNVDIGDDVVMTVGNTLYKEKMVR